MFWREGRLPVGHTLFMMSHFAVFYTGYVAISDINTGWIALKIWHNAQYIAFVWLQNNRRFGGSGARPDGSLCLAWPWQRKNLWPYLGFCLAISTAFYTGLKMSLADLAGGGGTALLIIAC